MKTVVFSDTHVSSKVYRRKLDYLRAVIEDADRVIIAGDFWDGFLTTFDKFVNSKWQTLFPLLLEKQAVYLYGNHDRPEWCDERVTLFSVEQGMATTIKTDTHDYHITHGHTVFTSYEDKWPVLNHKVPLRIGSNVDRVHKLVWGKRFLREGSKINTPMSEWVSENLPDEKILITGHSHYPEIDLTKRFVNSGFIGLGYASHVVIDGNGPQVIKARY